MAAIRSIFEYVSDKCYNGLYDAAKKYLDNHWRTMGLETRRVAEIKNAELIDATVQRVYVTDRPGNCIAFDIGLELEVCVSSADHHNDSDDTCYPWLRFSCEGDLSKGLDDWEIREITPYAKRNIPDNSMSDALVPDIRPAQYEKTATDFLEEYYPEALRITKVGEPPIYVDPYVLADRLGLSVLTHRINKEGSIFGQLFFLEADAEMYDIEHDKYVVIHVPAKTMLIPGCTCSVISDLSTIPLSTNVSIGSSTARCSCWKSCIMKKYMELPVRLSEGQEQICPSRQQRKWNSKLTD